MINFGHYCDEWEIYAFIWMNSILEFFPMEGWKENSHNLVVAYSCNNDQTCQIVTKMIKGSCKWLIVIGSCK